MRFFFVFATSQVGNSGSGYVTPEDIHFDASDNAFIGNLGGTIRKFDSSGTLLTTYSTPRTDWFDLNATETTAYFTDESGTIHRWNLSTNSALPDLGSGGQFALRLLGDPNTPASVRARVADSIFNHAIKAIEIEDIEVRVTQLEQAAEAAKLTRK